MLLSLIPPLTSVRNIVDAHGAAPAEGYDEYDHDADDGDADGDDAVDVIQYPHPRGDTQLLRPTLRDATHALTVRQPTVRTELY